MGQFFEKSKIVRQFGEMLVINCLLEGKDIKKDDFIGLTGKEITDWINSKFGENLPSSYIYPLLGKMSSGITPYLKEVKGRYQISADIQKTKKNGKSLLNENMKEECQETISFLKRILDALTSLEKKI